LNENVAIAPDTVHWPTRTSLCGIGLRHGRTQSARRDQARAVRPPGKPRPVLILTRDSAVAYLSRVTVAPITSSIRGVPSEVLVGPEDGLKQPSAVNLHNLVTVQKDRIGRRVAQLDDTKLRDVCRAVGFALGCEQ
jgi:mRNA interferase MazF